MLGPETAIGPGEVKCRMQSLSNPTGRNVSEA